jgi:hypothetical protein
VNTLNTLNTLKSSEDVKYGKLMELVNTVQANLDFFKLHNVPFIICGGSVFSTITETNFDDIDVFFYNKEDAERCCDALYATYTESITETSELIPLIENPYVVCKSENALTFINSLSVNNLNFFRKIQFIRCSVGTPSDILNKFDLNCSKIGINNKGGVHYTDDFSRYIDVNMDNFTVGSFSRYQKYVDLRGAVDKDSKTLIKILDNFIENPDRVVGSGYEGQPPLTALMVLIECIHNDGETPKGTFPYSTFLYKRICETRTPSERLYLFDKMQHYWFEVGLKDNDEYNVFQILKIEDPDDSRGAFITFESTDEVKRIKIKYAEYFI